MNKSISPTRTYVAMCSKPRFEGYYFRKFKLPESVDDELIKNNSEEASHYFLNSLDQFSCVDGCLSFEDYSNIKSAEEEKLVFPKGEKWPLD